ncbi:hypothetical protein ABPG75_003391 [Micractinium tetrahymenae]
MAPPTAPQGYCALCSATKSPSFRKNIILGKLICNACCCFLYRTVRGSHEGSGNLSQAVTDLALRLLAGKGSLPSMTDLRTKRHTRAAAWLGGSSLSLSLDPGASSGAEDSMEPPPRMLQPLPARQPHTLVEHGQSKQDPEAQQLLFEVLQNLGDAAQHREEVPEPVGQSCGHARRLAWEAAQRQDAQRQAALELARHRARACSQQEQPEQQARGLEQPCLSCKVPSAAAAAAAPAADRGSPSLERLREAAWRAAEDPKTAADAMMAAWRHGYSLPGLKLPGVSSTPLGAAPAIWLLQGEADASNACLLPLPAGVLLLRVQQPPAGLTPEAQQLMLSMGRGLESSLRLLVYSRRDGSLLQSKDWVAAVQCPLAPHPRFGLPCWDSGDGWQLLFPEPQIERCQAELFTATLRAFGAAPPAPAVPASPMGSPTFPHTPFAPALAFSGASPAKPAAAVQLHPAGTTHIVCQLGSAPSSVEAPPAGGKRVSPFAGQHAPVFAAAAPGACPTAQPQPSGWAAVTSGGSSVLLPGVPSIGDPGVLRPHASLSLSVQPAGGRCSPAGGSPRAHSAPPRQPLCSVADLAAYEVVDAACTDTWDPKGRAHGGAHGSGASSPLPHAAALPAELPVVGPAPAALGAGVADAGPGAAAAAAAAAAAGAEGVPGPVELAPGDEKLLSLALNMSWDFDLELAGLAGIAVC